MRKPESGDIRDRLTFLQFVGIYLGIVVGGVVLVIGAELISGIDGQRLILTYCGTIFGLAALGRPWWWSAAVRTAGWFAAVPNRLAERARRSAIFIFSASKLPRWRMQALQPARSGSPQ